MSQRHNKVVGGNGIEQARAIVTVILLSIFAIDFAFITRKCGPRSLRPLPHFNDHYIADDRAVCVGQFATGRKRHGNFSSALKNG